MRAEIARSPYPKGRPWLVRVVYDDGSRGFTYHAATEWGARRIGRREVALANEDAEQLEAERAAEWRPLP